MKNLIDKYIERIKIDFPEDDKLMIDLQDFAKEIQVKQSKLFGVSQQRELLVDFWMNLPNTNKNKNVAKHYIDKYLESTNCG
jgi:hypothetical protein